MYVKKKNKGVWYSYVTLCELQYLVSFSINGNLALTEKLCCTFVIQFKSGFMVCNIFRKYSGDRLPRTMLNVCWKGNDSEADHELDGLIKSKGFINMWFPMRRDSTVGIV